jgi:hypothetical protein
MSVSDVVALHVSVTSLDHLQGHCSYAQFLSASGFVTTLVGDVAVFSAFLVVQQDEQQ